VHTFIDPKMKCTQLLTITFLAYGILATPIIKDHSIDKRQSAYLLGGTGGNAGLPLTPAEILQQVQIENQIHDATQHIVDFQKQLLTLGSAANAGGLVGDLSSLQCSCNCGSSTNGINGGANISPL
jgi:hypothetical protein